MPARMAPGTRWKSTVSSMISTRSSRRTPRAQAGWRRGMFAAAARHTQLGHVSVRRALLPRPSSTLRSAPRPLICRSPTSLPGLLDYSAIETTRLACCQSFSALCCRNMTESSDPESGFLDHLAACPHHRALRGSAKKCWRKSPHSNAIIAQLESWQGQPVFPLDRAAPSRVDAMGAQLEEPDPRADSAPDWR